MKKIGIVLSAAMFLFAVPSIAFANPVTKSTKNSAYTVFQTDEDKYVIRMPVTGFDKSALEASLKGNVLTITGTPAKTEMKIVRKGFMPAAFTTSFTLVKNAAVSEVTVNAGMLSISVTVPLAEDQRTKKIPVR
jgi:HSP20 family molecular chaperone IbpA